MNLNLILLGTLFAPAAAALLSLAIPTRYAGCFRRLAAISTLASLAGVLLLFAGYQPAADGLAYHIRATWVPELGASFHIGVDGTSMVLLLLAGLVNVAGVLAGGPITSRPKEYFVLYQLLASGAMLAVTTLDLLLFYVALEVDVLCAFLLIACWGDFGRAPGSRTPANAALLLTLFLAAGAMLASLGLWALYHAGGGTFDLLALQARFATQPLGLELQTGLFLVLLAGFGVLLSIWPLHVWAPPGYAAAPTGMSMISAGLLKTLGAYGLIRVALPLLPDGARACSGLMAGLAIVNILYGSWLAMRQTDWKYLLTYGSISHMGYVLLGLATLNAAGSTGAVLILFAQGLATAAAFALMGQVEAQAGSRTIGELGGLARTLPFVGAAMLLATFGMCGLPGFASFWGEILVFVGAWQQGTLPFRLAATAAALGLVLTATYLLAAIRTSFFGPARITSTQPLPAPSCGFRLACVLLIAAAMIVGFAPRIVSDLVAGSRYAPHRVSTADFTVSTDLEFVSLEYEDSPLSAGITP